MSRTVLAATLRHNIRLASDINLAQREFAALVGDSAEMRQCSRTELVALMSEAMSREEHRCVLARLRHGDAAAFLVQSPPPASVGRVVRRAAFLQDVLLFGSEADQRAAFSGLSSSSFRIGERVGIAPVHAMVAEVGTALVDGLPNRAQVYKAMQNLLQFLLTGTVDKRWQLAIERAVAAKQTTLSLTHDLHIYKAKFFPRLVRALINIYGQNAERLVDPFSGSGTALLEASSLGLESIGIDLDPISALISGAKVEPFTRRRDEAAALLREAESFLQTAGDKTSLFQPPLRASPRLPLELHNKLARRDARDGTHYLEEIENDVAALIEMNPLLDRDHTGLLRVLLSDAVTKKIRYRFVGVGNGRYTIEVVRKRIVDRLRDKVVHCQSLIELFAWLEGVLGVKFAPSGAIRGDARAAATLIAPGDSLLCLTSPPYLPASSGREHYAESRQLAFSVTGLEMQASSLVGAVGSNGGIDLSQFTPSSVALLQYLSSDSDRTDPQRDPMRFARKAVPTSHYLLDVERFLRSLRNVVGTKSSCLLVVASQHTFYSHRRKEVEYVAECAPLYGELAERAGWTLSEALPVELAKHSTSMARPQTTEDYYESVLVLHPAVPRGERAAFHDDLPSRHVGAA